MNIPSGSILTWKGTWTPSLPEWAGGGSSQDISTQLAAVGLTAKSIDVSSSDILGQVLNLGPAPVSGTIVVQATSGVTYTDGDAGMSGEDQVRANIEGAIYNATGNQVTGSQISDVQLPAGAIAPGAPSTAAPGTKVSVTPPSQVTTAKPTCASGFSGWLNGVFGGCTPAPSAASSGFSLSSIGSTTTLYVGLAILGFIAALALLGYSGVTNVRRVNVT